MTISRLPHAIILNGASSSGKTSIARSLQEILPELYLNLSIDTILHQLPRSDLARMIKGEHIERRGYCYDRLVLGHHAAAATLLRRGIPLILDNALTRDEWKLDLRTQLSDHRAYWVGVSCDPAESVRRERDRGDRAPGIAQGEADLVHTGMSYDLMVDTSAQAPNDIAHIILDALSAQ